MNFTTTYKCLYSKSEWMRAIAAMYPDNPALMAQLATAKGISEIRVELVGPDLQLTWDRIPGRG